MVTNQIDLVGDGNRGGTAVYQLANLSGTNVPRKGRHYDKYWLTSIFPGVYVHVPALEVLKAKIYSVVFQPIVLKQVLYKNLSKLHKHWYPKLLKINPRTIFGVSFLRFILSRNRSGCQTMGKRGEWLAKKERDKAWESEVETLSKITPYGPSKGADLQVTEVKMSI